MVIVLSLFALGCYPKNNTIKQQFQKIKSLELLGIEGILIISIRQSFDFSLTEAVYEKIYLQTTVDTKIASFRGYNLVQT